MTDRARWWIWTLAAAAATVVLRLRFVGTPLTADEAGALVVARGWGEGRALYTDLFIDRPQGVIVLVQQWEAALGGGAWTIRLLAALAGVSVVVSVASMTRTLTGSWRAGATAAGLAAVLTSSPVVEGFTTNGELLAAAWTAPALAVASGVVVHRTPPPWMLVAGVLAGIGATMKQSGIDGFATVAVWLVLAAFAGWRPRAEVARWAALLVAGTGSILAVAAYHGASLGWSSYTYALVGFRAEARSIAAGARWSSFVLTGLAFTALVAPAIVVARRQVRRLPPGTVGRSIAGPPLSLATTWLAVTFVTMLAGGNFHRHYWLAVVPPLSVVVGAALASAPLTWRALAAAFVVPVLATLVVTVDPRLERDPRADADVAIARWLRSDATSPEATLVTLCASTTFYVEADQAPPMRYLWVDHVRHGRGAVDEIESLLAGPRRPDYVALHQPPAVCDPSGRIAAALRASYRPVEVIEGVEVLGAR